MCYMIIIVLFTLNALEFATAGRLGVGSSCLLGLSRTRGTCRYQSDCPGTQSRIVFSEICSFEGSRAIMCCPVKPQTTTQSSITPTSPKVSLIIPKLHKTDKQIITALKPGQLSKYKCETYYPPDQDLISKGSKASRGEFPHMAALGYGRRDEFKCGGSLISKKFVLTAAHCFIDTYPKYVKLGYLDPTSSNSQDFDVVRRIPHPSYRKKFHYNDIGLIELDREVHFSGLVSPACLNTEEIIIWKQLSTIGWGKLEHSGPLSESLQKVDLQLFPHNKCSNKFGTPDNLPHGITEGMQICAKGMERGQDSCSGDSGGPLQVKNSAKSYKVPVYNIVGVTSTGTPCGLNESVGIYTSVYNYIDWIETIVWINEN